MSATIFIFLSAATSAALVDIGGGLIYDDVLDITWAQPDASNSFRNWDAANTWVSGLTLGGVSGWRLPYIFNDGVNTITENSDIEEQRWCSDRANNSHLICIGKCGII